MMKFNRNPLKFGNSIESPSQDVLRNTLGLVNASIEDAIRYGGDITKAAIGAMKLRNDRKNLIVDVKIHMLMPGFYPAIPGWHCDGVPRGTGMNPLSKENPRMDLQILINEGKLPGIRPTRYHMLVTGAGCLTEFVNGPIQLDDNSPDWKTSKIYARMNEQVENREAPRITVPSCQVTEFDWWDIHRGVQAKVHEWRYFIRVAEIDIAEPEKDLRKVIRTQHQVYAPANFSW